MGGPVLHMAKPAPPREAVAVVIPVHNAAERLEKVVPAWGDALARLGREYQILVIDDGSTDTTPSILEKFAAGRVKHLRTLRHDTRRGFGACLRTALEVVSQPLFFYTSADYPYTPSDLRPLLERIEVRDEILGRSPDLISGCRTGQAKPALVRWGGLAWRILWRVAVGLNLQPSPAWQGMRETLYGLVVGWLFGVPLSDVNSAFKLYRTAFLKRFPIQSDGDFVHTELVAKGTFLTSIMDEIPLTPAAVRDPGPPSVWRELWVVFKNPDFGSPPLPQPPAPGGEIPPQPPPTGTPREPVAQTPPATDPTPTPAEPPRPSPLLLWAL